MPHLNSLLRGILVTFVKLLTGNFKIAFIMKLFLSFAFTFIISFAFAQETLPKKNSENTVINIKGKIIDQATQKAMFGAVVQLLSVTPASPDYLTDNSFSRTVLTDKNGNFEINNVPFAEQYNINVTVIGYASYTKTISFDKQGEEETARKNIITKALEPIALTQETKNLGTVVVTAAAKPTMQLDIDKKVFNVDKNITAQGGTAVDVMKNIPSVSVDVNGNVQVRNSSPQILLDGRPTILTLDQIPADDIDKIEVVTNPSAKYDASNAGGVINIVLKKNKRVGFNALASIGAGSPDVLNGNINLNLRQKKFNFFASGSYNYSGGTAKEETYRINKSNGIITDYFNQTSENNRSRKFMSGRVGLDYFVDDKTTLTFTQNFTQGRFGNNEQQNQQYLDSLYKLSYTGLRYSDGTGSFNRSSSRLSLDKIFDKPDNKLSADITYNRGTRSNESVILNDYYNLDGTVYAPQTRVRNTGSGEDHQLTAQIDYSNKINDDKRIEAGLRSYYRNTSTNFGTFSVDETNVETKLPLSNDYKYSETVNAGYINYANKWKGIQYQVGLRMEFSKLDGELIDSAFHFGYKYPEKLSNIYDAMFPSVFITKELTENQSIQFNYSKRVRRPRFWEVNPFVDINDPLNISLGNPALRPEFTNSFEFNYFNQLKNGNFLGVIYFKNNVGDITDYSDTISTKLYQQLINAGVSPNAIVNTYINAGYTNRVGSEFTLQKKFFKNLDLTYNINFQYRKTHAVVNGLDLSNQGFNWDTKFIGNYKIVSPSSKFFNNLNFQLVSEYESPHVIPQGKEKGQFVTDFAMRKEFLKNNKAALSFSINDVFNTRRYGTIYDTEDFYQDSYSRWSVRTFRVTFSYKFGDADFNFFKKKNNSNNGGDNEGDNG